MSSAQFTKSGGALRLNDWFCGAGGATQGAHAVPGIQPILAANHDPLAIETHSTNFPDVEHFRGTSRTSVSTPIPTPNCSGHHRSARTGPRPKVSPQTSHCPTRTCSAIVKSPTTSNAPGH